MKLLRSYPLLVFLLVSVAIAGYSLSQRSLVLLIVAGTLAVVSWFVTEGPRGRTIPSWVSHVLVLGVSIGVIIDWHQHQADWTGVLGRYAIWLSIIKLYERKSPRDYSQLLAFSLLLMVTATLQSADLLFSAALLVYAILGLYVLLLHQIHSAYEREKMRRNESVPRGYRLAPMFKPVIGQRVGVHFRITAALVGAVGLFLSVVLFVAVPRGRGEETIPGLPTATQRRTMFLDQIDLGRGSRITDSRRPVMRVQLLDGQGAPLRNPPYLIRGGVMALYEGDGQWRPMPAEPVLIGTVPDTFTTLASGVETSPDTIVQRYKLDVPLDVLPTMAMPVALKTSSSVALEYDPVEQIIRRPEHTGRVQSYEVRSQPRPSAETARSLLHDRKIIWTSFRYRSRRVRELAQQLLGSNGLPSRRPADPREAWRWSGQAAGLFQAYLQSPEFTYTLDLSDIAAPGEGVDPIEQFLFETKRGHCEYFASAMAALCHTVGIQARVITGFVAYEYDQAAQEYLISENNAHAWVEVRSGFETWDQFDPTPPGVLDTFHNVQATLPDRVQRFMSSLENGFGSTFLDFDEQDQHALASVLDMGWSERLGAMWAAIRDWARRVNRSFQLGNAGYIWMGIVAFALIIAIIALIKLMRRSFMLRKTLQLQSIHGSEYQRMLRQLGFYLDMLYVLRKGGCEKPPWQPPWQFADGLASARPEVAVLVRRMTGLFYEARFGRRPLARAETQQARADLAQLASELGVRL